MGFLSSSSSAEERSVASLAFKQKPQFFTTLFNFHYVSISSLAPNHSTRLLPAVQHFFGNNWRLIHLFGFVFVLLTAALVGLSSFKSSNRWSSLSLSIGSVSRPSGSFEQTSSDLYHFSDIVVYQGIFKPAQWNFTEPSGTFKFSSLSSTNQTWHSETYYATFKGASNEFYGCFLQQSVDGKTYSCPHSEKLPSGAWKVELIKLRHLDLNNCLQLPLQVSNNLAAAAHLPLHQLFMDFPFKNLDELYTCFKYPHSIVASFTWQHIGPEDQQQQQQTAVSQCNNSAPGYWVPYKHAITMFPQSSKHYIWAKQLKEHNSSFDHIFISFGCYYKFYDAGAARKCLKANPMVFSGDSRMRRLYTWTVGWLGEDFVKDTGGVNYVSLANFRHFYFGLSSFRIATQTGAPRNVHTESIQREVRGEIVYTPENIRRWALEGVDASTTRETLFDLVRSGQNVVVHSLLHDLAKMEIPKITVQYVKEHYKEDACAGCGNDTLAILCGCHIKCDPLKQYLNNVEWLGQELAAALQDSPHKEKQHIVWVPLSKRPPSDTDRKNLYGYQTHDFLESLEDSAGARLVALTGARVVDLRHITQSAPAGMWVDGIHFDWWMGFTSVQILLNVLC